MNRTWRPLIALSLACMLVAGQPLHSLIPHTHGEEPEASAELEESAPQHEHEHDHEHGSESSVWQSLHASMRHEDKKFFVTPAAVPLSDRTDLAIITLILVICVYGMYACFRASLLDMMLLRRGIALYRRFG